MDLECTTCIQHWDWNTDYYQNNDGSGTPQYTSIHWMTCLKSESHVLFSSLKNHIYVLHTGTPYQTVLLTSHFKNNNANAKQEKDTTFGLDWLMQLLRMIVQLQVIHQFASCSMTNKSSQKGILIGQYKMNVMHILGAIHLEKSHLLNSLSKCSNICFTVFLKSKPQNVRWHNYIYSYCTFKVKSSYPLQILQYLTNLISHSNIFCGCVLYLQSFKFTTFYWPFSPSFILVIAPDIKCTSLPMSFLINI